MARSGRLRLQDRQQIDGLVGECCELGDDAMLWSRHFLRRVAPLTGAGCGQKSEGHQFVGAAYSSVWATDWGIDSGFDSQVWPEMLAALRINPRVNLAFNSYLARMPTSNGRCLARTDLLRDPEWYSSDYYQNLQRRLGVNHILLLCNQIVTGEKDGITLLVLGRSIDDPDFTSREKSIAELASQKIRPLIGRSLALMSDPPPSALPRRVRVVLQYCLEGDSDKQIASRLGISRFTVNDYIRKIYQHFRVSSRAELLALWIRRRWPMLIDLESVRVSPRLLEVLQCCLEGDSNKQIAARLRLSLFTVKEYTKLIYEHFDVTSRAELLALWVAHGPKEHFAWLRS